MRPCECQGPEGIVTRARAREVQYGAARTCRQRRCFSCSTVEPRRHSDLRLVNGG